MTWVDLSAVFTYGSKLTSTQMQQLRDNLTALANGDSGAPAIQTAAIDDLAVTTAAIGDLAVTQAKIKVGSGSVNTTAAANMTLPGGAYGFYPRVSAVSGSTITAQLSASLASVSSVTNVYFFTGGGGTGYVYQTYVTSSGERHWVFILREKQTGKIISQSESHDHICFGNGGKPDIISHPFRDVQQKNKKLFKGDDEVEIIVINPSMSQVKKIIQNQEVDDDGLPDLNFLQSMHQLYEIDELNTPPWNDEPITVGLPRIDSDKNVIGDYRFAVGKKVVPIKKQIKKPTMIEIAQLKRKQS